MYNVLAYSVIVILQDSYLMNPVAKKNVDP